MDKSTLSNYGWVVIVTLVLAVMLALATPFGQYVGKGASNIIKTFANSSKDAIDENSISAQSQKWDEYLNEGNYDIDIPSPSSKLFVDNENIEQLRTSAYILSVNDINLTKGKDMNIRFNYFDGTKENTVITAVPQNELASPDINGWIYTKNTFGESEGIMVIEGGKIPSSGDLELIIDPAYTTIVFMYYGTEELANIESFEIAGKTFKTVKPTNTVLSLNEGSLFKNNSSEISKVIITFENKKQVEMSLNNGTIDINGFAEYSKFSATEATINLGYSYSGSPIKYITTIKEVNGQNVKTTYDVVYSNEITTEMPSETDIATKNVNLIRGDWAKYFAWGVRQTAYGYSEPATPLQVYWRLANADADTYDDYVKALTKKGLTPDDDARSKGFDSYTQVEELLAQNYSNDDLFYGVSRYIPEVEKIVFENRMPHPSVLATLAYIPITDPEAAAQGNEVILYLNPNDRTIVHIAADGMIFMPVEMSNFFAGCTKLKEIQFNNCVSTRLTTKMLGVFSNCSSLTKIDLSFFDTSNVTVMSNMFAGCTNLQSIDLSSFNTKNVKYMNRMFENCNSLTTFNASNLETENVVSMYEMFDANITDLNIEGFNMKNVKDAESMFGYSTKIKTLRISKNYDIRNIAIGGVPNTSAVTVYFDGTQNEFKTLTNGRFYNGTKVICTDGTYTDAT